MSARLIFLKKNEEGFFFRNWSDSAFFNIVRCWTFTSGNHLNRFWVINAATGELNFVSAIEWLWLVDEGYCSFSAGVGKILMNLLCGFGGINRTDCCKIDERIHSAGQGLTWVRTRLHYRKPMRYFYLLTAQVTQAQYASVIISTYIINIRSVVNTVIRHAFRCKLRDSIRNTSVA